MRWLSNLSSWVLKLAMFFGKLACVVHRKLLGMQQALSEGNTASLSSTITLLSLVLTELSSLFQRQNFLHFHRSAVNINHAMTFTPHPLSTLFLYFCPFFFLPQLFSQSSTASLCFLVCFYHDPLQLLYGCVESEPSLHTYLMHRESLKLFHHLPHVQKIWQLSQTGSGWPVCSQPNHNHHNTLLIIMTIKQFQFSLCSSLTSCMNK